MDISDWVRLWRNDSFLKTEPRRFWDLRTEDPNRCVDGVDDAGIDKLLRFLAERQVFNPEAKILDIGCGPGKYSRAFAKRVNQVTAIDISPEIINYASENPADGSGNNIVYETSAWEAVDLDARGWRKAYDLVFASMCPGISGADALRKMSEASRGSCFLSGFVEKKDSIGDRLYRTIYGQEPARRGKNLYYALNILLLSGYYPEVTYNDAVWEQVLPLEQAVEVYRRKLKRNEQLKAGLIDRISAYLATVAVNGLVTEKSQVKIAWLFWRA